MNKPLVSVITTVYNTEKYVKKCFQSVLEQTYDNIEFIIVDNASKGNIDCIAKEYIAAYPDRNIKLISLSQNNGLYAGRLQGILAATGNYIAFIDSDDYVSKDFYRLLVMLAETRKADIVASDVILEFANKDKIFENLNPYHLENIDLTGEQIENYFWGQEGECYYWHLVWNKLYSRELIKKSLPALLLQSANIVMSDDMAFSTVFFSNVKHFVSTNLVQYYYIKREDAYTASGSDVNKFKSNLQNIKDVFSYMERIQKEYHQEKKYGINLKHWKNRYQRIWIHNIKNSKLTWLEKRNLLKNNLAEYFDDENPDLTSSKDDFFYQLNTPYYPYIEDYITKITDPKVKCVSFDVFDTLIVRPLYSPEDLFVLMNDFVKAQIGTIMEPDFKEMRKFGESLAREDLKNKSNYDEVTLDEIYENIKKQFKLSDKTVNRIKEKEIGLELQLVQQRQFGKYLFDLVKFLGKKLICISDMYLPKEIVYSMLQKCGYEISFDDVFLSSECRITKYNRDLFKYVLNKISLDASQMLHIGDNDYSDICVPNKLGIKTLQIPKTIDLFLSCNNTSLSSNFFYKCIKDNSRMIPDSSVMFLSMRCAHGISANKLFDMPFNQINSNIMNFNANPYAIGFSLMGPALLGICHWLYENASAKGYDCIHFIARDGYLVHKAFRLLQPHFGKYQPKIDYIRVSRKAIFPLMVLNKIDLCNLEIAINYLKQSPLSIMKLLRPILKSENCSYSFIKKKGFIPEKKFHSRKEYISFLCIIRDELLDQNALNNYRAIMKKYFSSLIGSNDCFFDVGYSGRTESLLKALTGYNIDTFYLNTTTQTGMDNARVNDFKITTFFGNLPNLCGPIRELLLSEQGPSCIGFDIVGETVKPLFEEYKTEFSNDYIMKLYQRGALDFIQAFVDAFGDGIQMMSFRDQDLSWSLEYFLMNASPSDLSIFKNIEFEDDLFIGKKQNITDYWIQNQNRPLDGFLAAYNSKGNISKAITLYLYDREHLKDVIKKRLAGHSLMYRVSKKVYHLAKAPK